MFTHQFKLNQRGNRLASSSLWAVCLAVVLTIFLANSVTLPVLANPILTNPEEVKPTQFASIAAQIQQGEMELKEVTPAVGQISGSGSGLRSSGPADHISQLGNAGHSPEFDLKVAPHENEEWIYPTRGNQRGVQTRTSNTGAPYIVANGVQMYDVHHAEAGGWSTRAISDDTYGNGELIAVSVEFSEPISVDNETTFRISLDSGYRDLVSASRRDNTVIFAALVQPSNRDSNGVWIGDNTSTLDHNDADAIRSKGDSPRNANLTHASLGTQSNHKVDGSKERPRLQSVRISSRPQHADAYVRGETVKIKARFDRPVTVNGILSLHLNVEALQATASRFADYVDGSGTSTLDFEHIVTLLENDGDGIVIPANTLAEGGDLAMGPRGGGSIVGKQGGLIADLFSRQKGPLSNQKVDARFATVPEIMASAFWDWDSDTPGSESFTMDFNIREDPGHFSETNSYILAIGWGYIEGVLFGFGLRTDVDKPGTDGSQGKGIIFNQWGTEDPSTHARPAGDGWVESGSFQGPFLSIRRTYEWAEGNYSVRIAQDGADDTDGRWFGFWVTDKSTGVETHVGSFKFSFPDEGNPEIKARSTGIGSLIAVLGGGADLRAGAEKPHDLPVFEVAMELPDASGGDAPTGVNVNYSIVHGVMTNSNVTYDSDTGKVIIRVGGTTSRTTPLGSTITDLQTPQLTASIGDIPESHDGSAKFNFELTFSEEPGPNFSYKTLRDDAFSVTGGSVTSAKRLDRPSNIRWRITVRPDSTGDVEVVLPVPDYCGAQGAICTPDGRELSAAVNLTVPGPEE